MFGIQGLVGFLILVVVLVSALIGLGTEAWLVQKEQATNYYSVEQRKNKCEPPQLSLSFDAKKLRLQQAQIDDESPHNSGRNGHSI